MDNKTTTYSIQVSCVAGCFVFMLLFLVVFFWTFFLVCGFSN